MSIPIPTNIEFEKWVRMLKMSYPNLNISNPVQVEEWQRWASIFISSNGFSIPVPSKLSFNSDKSWREWARLLFLEPTLT